MKRHHILENVVNKLITARKAQKLLGIIYRQLLRLKKRFILYGIEGIIRKKPPYPPNAKIEEKVKKEIVELRKTLYHDFNILHLKDKLAECHKIHISYESLRKLLIKEGLHMPKAKRKIYRKRRRMPEAGLLVQMDSSQHRWIEDIEKLGWLVAMIDDADEYVYAEFHHGETTISNMKVIKEYILRKEVALWHFTLIKHPILKP